MLHTLADAFVSDIESLHGDRASALLEAAVKSAALLILYGEEERAEYSTTLADAIERSLTKAAIPSDLWSELVGASRERRTYPAVRDLTFETRKGIGRYLSDLVVMSRVKNG